ncbi:MAG: hypothetical protein H0U59_07925 [Gemmatimonadaceae bacterium]|nr:hypothetical protein [Gemmatimonadaceae bacterium]
MTLLRFAGLAGMLSVLAASPLAAQQSDSDRRGVPRTNLVSTNPIGLIFEWFNGEFEHAVNPTVSLALAGTRFDFDDANYTAVDGIARYYPTARAIRAFSFGGSVGYVNVTEDCPGCESFEESAFTIGVRGDYVWILGRDQRFAVAAGIGAKRLFYSDDTNNGSEGLPIGRLSIGWAW